MNAKQRRKARRAFKRSLEPWDGGPLVVDGKARAVRIAVTDAINKTLPEGVTVRFTPIVDGQLGKTLYACSVCGKCKASGPGWMCDDCIPF